MLTFKYESWLSKECFEKLFFFQGIISPSLLKNRGWGRNISIIYNANENSTGDNVGKELLYDSLPTLVSELWMVYSETLSRNHVKERPQKPNMGQETWAPRHKTWGWRYHWSSSWKARDWLNPKCLKFGKMYCWRSGIWFAFL